MDDAAIHRRIADLVEEEHRLRHRRQGGELDTEEEQSRLRDLEESLDQMWDLLRRRDAARRAGQDPDQVQSRARGEVEGYLQ